MSSTDGYLSDKELKDVAEFLSRDQLIELLIRRIKEIRKLKERVATNNLVAVLKRTLEGNEDCKVIFDNEEDNINYVLDVCNNFRKELALQKCE